jgi:hypothetical protein
MSQPIQPIFVPQPDTNNVVAGNLLVEGDATVDGDLIVKGSFTPSEFNPGNISLSGNLTVTGTTSLVGGTSIGTSLTLPNLQAGTGTLVGLVVNSSNEVVVGSASGGGSVTAISTSDPNLVFTPNPIMTTGTIAINSSPTFSGLLTADDGLTVAGNSQLGTASSSNTVKSAHNTLDDGDGNMIITSTNSSGGPSLALNNLTSNTLTLNGVSPAGYANLTFQLAGSSIANIATEIGENNLFISNGSFPFTFYFEVSFGTGAVTTLHNTLDNGSGNMTIKGTITGSTGQVLTLPATTGTLALTSQIPASLSLTSANSNIVLSPTTITGTGTITASTTPTFGATTVTTLNATNIIATPTSGTGIIIDGAGIGPTLQFQVSTGYKTTIGWDNGFFIYDNINTNYLLQQGGTASGHLQTLNNTLDDGSGNMTTISLTTPLISGGNLDSIITDQYLNFHFPNGVGYTWSVANFAGTQMLAVGNNKQVKTANNTLDDGSGNMSLAGQLNLLTPGGYPTVGINSNGSGGAFLEAGSLNFFFKTAATSGASWQVSKQGGSTWFSISNAGNVSTLHNTLDNGSGNMTIVGTITGASSQVLTLPATTGTLALTPTFYYYAYFLASGSPTTLTTVLANNFTMTSNVITSSTSVTTSQIYKVTLNISGTVPPQTSASVFLSAGSGYTVIPTGGTGLGGSSYNAALSTSQSMSPTGIGFISPVTTGTAMSFSITVENITNSGPVGTVCIELMPL